MHAARLHSRPALAGATAVVLLVLLLQARQPLWAYHLSGDIALYAQRAGTFAAARSWTALGVNWFPPGALFFFLVPQALVSFLSYPDALFLLNACLLVLHIVVLRAIGGAIPAWLGLALFLLAGPISLFRFDLLVSLLTLLALLAWKRRTPLASGILLGLAIGVKVYPICLLPFMLWESGKRTSSWAFSLLLGSSLGVGALLVAFFLTGGSAVDVVRSLEYHIPKPVALDSVMGTLAIAAGTIRGHLPQPVNEYGIHGFPLPAFVQQLSLAGFLGTVLLLFLKGVWWRARTPIALLLAAATVSLLFWSPGLQPQYLLWTLGFMALLPLDDFRRPGSARMIALYGALLFMEQVHFPTHYTQFLNLLYRGEPHPVLLGVFLCGKAFFLLLAILLFREALRVQGAFPARPSALSGPASALVDFRCPR